VSVAGGEVPFLDLSAMTSAVQDQVLRGWRQTMDTSSFIGGEPVAEFEAGLAALCDTRHAVGMANGTDALHLTLRALGIGPGDEVVVPANTFVATVEGVVLAGASPRFADVDPDTLLVTAASVEAAVTPRTRAVIIVHLYGQMPDMDALGDLAADLDLVLLEDAAQAHGATWQGRPAGSFGVAGCFSFYPGKNLGAFGDAGAAVTSDDALADRLRSLRDHGRVSGSHHEHGHVGTNSRLDTVQAVVLQAKLPMLEQWNLERRHLVAAYRELLDPERTPLLREAPGSHGVHHLAVVRVHGRDQVRASLASAGIGTGIHYPTPCHRMGPYSAWAHRDLPVVERAADQVLSLPLFPGMTTAQAERVAHEIDRAVRRSAA
jgi:dTDP-4-amino-4,6-dideoxygalactose transaminase